jgi:hypothetical protein
MRSDKANLGANFEDDLKEKMFCLRLFQKETSIFNKENNTHHYSLFL